MPDNPRAVRVLAEAASRWRAERGGGDVAQQRGQFRLVLTSEPDAVRVGGQVVGVRVRCRLFHLGAEVPIDPDRVIVNPPMGVVEDPGEYGTDGAEIRARVVRDDPAEALWAALWDSIQSTPGVSVAAPGRRGRR